MRVEEAFSEDLLQKKGKLTPRQQAALPALVVAYHEGRVRQLLRGPDRPCAWSTFYRPDRGWYNQPLFREVLEQARREYEDYLLRVAVDEAASLLRRTTLISARVLEGEVREALEIQAPSRREDDLSFAERQLYLLINHGDESIRVRALGTLARLYGSIRSRGMKAATEVLDRADIETAVKSAGGAEAEWRGLLEELRGLAEDGEMADVEAEAGGVPAAGVRAARGAGGGTSEPGAGDPGSGGGAEREESVDGD